MASFLAHNRRWKRPRLLHPHMCCPKCQFDHELQTTECLKCGIVFSRYQAAIEAKKKNDLDAHLAQALRTRESDIELFAARDNGLTELKYRAVALPLALLIARLAVGTGFGFIAGLLAMLVHESGHAITAWLTGRWAIPTLWVTMRGEERSWLVVLALTAAILYVGFLAWKAQRWGWVCAAAVVLLVQLIFLIQPNFTQGALIVFGGDGGALVLASILMATFYAPRESKLYQSWGVRWGLLAMGALSFMYVFHVWSGPIEDLPFGEIEGVGLSDPSMLTEKYGWTVTQLVDRYNRLAVTCLVALAAVYAWGLIAAYLETRSLARDKGDSTSWSPEISTSRGEMGRR